jgi:predicted transcriptional regulator
MLAYMQEDMMARTTIILDDSVLLDVKQLAQVRHTTTTQIVHEALTAYLEHHSGTAIPSFAGAGRSGRHSIARNAEAELRKRLGKRKRV